MLVHLLSVLDTELHALQDWFTAKAATTLEATLQVALSDLSDTCSENTLSGLSHTTIGTNSTASGGSDELQGGAALQKSKLVLDVAQHLQKPLNKASVD